MERQVNLTTDQLRRLANFLQKSCGIFLDDKKLTRFQRKIETIVHEYESGDFNRFYHRLRFAGDKELVQALINAVTINETYFWREHEQFRILVEEILPSMVDQNRLRHIRILVLPCASGEEVYSIMLAILDKKGLLERLNIELIGVDIDTDMIKMAKRACYSQRSVSKLPKHLVDSYFTKDKGSYCFDKELVSLVQFFQVNIFEENLKSRLGEFDIIFSRNMLIYFNKEDKRRSLERFHSLLKSGGYLFLGHADAGMLDRSMFEPYVSGFQVYRRN